MPRVEKTSGGRVSVRGAGEYRRGEQYDVDGDTAAYLVEERGDFVYVDEADTDAKAYTADGDFADDIVVDPADVTLDELEEALASVEDIDVLDELEAAERAEGSPRTGALELFDDRRDDLEA